VAEARCRVNAPAMVEARPGHFVACHVRAPATRTVSVMEETS
jgi:hypothetical protein